MNRYTLIGLAVGLVVGIFIGYQAASSSSPSGPVVAAPAMPPMPGGAPPMQAPAANNVQARVTALQQVVARDPKNVQAWIQLGNDYFDLRQPQKAIEAYGRALELNPKDANVLTDQGIMYRDVGQFDKALANFEKANKADPKHVQSLFNMGVVYLHDLRQPKKAIEIWTRVIQIAPESEQAAQARGAIEEAKRSGG